MQPYTVQYSTKNPNRVTAPCKPAEYLDVLRTNPISKFQIKNGGCFVVDDKISIETKIDLLEILCSLVTLHKKNDNIPIHKKRAYSVLPEMLIQISKEARNKEASLRLLKRTITHSIEPNTKNIKMQKEWMLGTMIQLAYSFMIIRCWHR
jgi:hypothetical protein